MRVSFAHAGNVHGNVIPVRCNRQPGAGFSPGGVQLPGPIPKRSDQRIRRNKPDVQIEKVESIGTVQMPDLGFDDPHPMVVDFYLSLADSAQSRFYEPSDWQFARFCLHFVDYLLKSQRPSGQLLATVQSMLTELLVSEGARRRVRLEVERSQSGGDVLDVADLFRARLAQG